MHVGNPVTVLPGNQEVISRPSRSSQSPPSSKRVGSFISVTSPLPSLQYPVWTVIRCIAGSADGGVEKQTTKNKTNKSRSTAAVEEGEGSEGNTGGDEEEREGDIYSSAVLTALRLRCSFLFSPTIRLASSLRWSLLPEPSALMRASVWLLPANEV